MQTHVEFRSARFGAYPEEAAFENPDRRGKRLAEFVQPHGIAAGQPYAEDWRWAVPIENLGLRVGCGGYPDGYLCFIEPDEDAVEALRHALDAMLSSDPSIHAKRRWTHEEFNR